MTYTSVGSSGSGRVVPFLLSVALSWALIVSDHYYANISSKIRYELAQWLLRPARVIAALPADAWLATSVYFKSREEIRRTVRAHEEERLRALTRLDQLEHIEAENDRLRTLVATRRHFEPEPLVAEIANTASLPFINRIVLSKGSSEGIKMAQGVFNDQGVIGRLSRVDADSSQALLLTDKNFWVATRIRRNGTLILLQGDGGGRMRLRFTPADAEIEAGNLLVTANGTGLFPAGIPVARVRNIWRPTGTSFLEGIAIPVASVQQESLLLVNNSTPSEAAPALSTDPAGAVPASLEPEVLP